MSDNQEDFADNVAWFIAGAVAGVIAALLLAPQSGKQTRRFIADKTQQGRDAVTETGKDVVDRGKEMVDKGRQLVDDAVDLFERGRKLVRG